MKKWMAALLAAAMLLVSVSTALALEVDFGALTDSELDALIRDAMAERSARQTAHVPETVKPSPDKYTWYVQDYVGRNAAACGYTSLLGDRRDSYGTGTLVLTYVTEDGAYIDIEDNSDLQKYVVTGQNAAPNSEIKYVFEKDSKGNEYSSLLESQSVTHIDLTVKRIDGRMAGDPVGFELMPITPSPDKYTFYIRNYVGKNVAAFGYTSMLSDRRDTYGDANIRFIFVSEDGAFIDPEDVDVMRQYVVTAQDVAPNTEMRLVYEKDSQGNEYSSLIESQTYQNITLYVRKLGSSGWRAAAADEDGTPAATATSTAAAQVTPTPTATATPAPTPTATPFAADGAVLNNREFKYRVLSDGNVEICGFVRASSTMSLPSDIDGRDVTRIADGAFEGCAELKTLLIWADLEWIGASAFKNCTSLKEISIPSETTYIGESAFEGCTALKSVLMWGDPEGIEKNTFKGCAKLGSISLPSSVEYIAESAFEGCEKLDSVLIWGDITYIGKNAFRDCARLDRVSIPSSCEVIEESAFQGCTDLDSVILWGDTNIGDSAFRGCTSLETISISSDTEYIGDYAFEGCTSLENVTLWGRSTQIGKDAFANCPNLKKVPQ